MISILDNAKPPVTLESLFAPNGIPATSLPLLQASVEAFLTLCDSVAKPSGTLRPGETVPQAFGRVLRCGDREQNARYSLFHAIYQTAPEVARELRYIGAIQMDSDAARAYCDHRIDELCAVLAIRTFQSEAFPGDEFEVIAACDAVVFADGGAVATEPAAKGDRA